MKADRFILPFLVVIYLQLFTVISANAQVYGCTDPQATNYNPDATHNDGSCVYPPTTVGLTVVVNALPSAVNETSGLQYWNGGFWTHNDSGNSPELYKLDTITGQVIQTITISGVQNIDWEDIAQDEQYLYIGDFGNNAGNRTDLRVLKLQKSQIPASGNASVEPEIINFSYGDQNTFKKANRNNDFDCEAIISYGDSLYLFSKNWVNQQTRFYALSKQQGTFVIYPRDSFNADGLITGADVRNSGEIALIGYKNYNPFMWLLFDFQSDNFFSGNKRRINFSAVLGVQTEGIGYTFGGNVYISSEKTAVNPPKLFKTNTSQWTYPVITEIEDMIPLPGDGEGLLIYPNPNNGNFKVNFSQQAGSNQVLAELYSVNGALLRKHSFQPVFGPSEFSYHDIPDGFYVLRFCFAESVQHAKFLVCNRP